MLLIVICVHIDAVGWGGSVFQWLISRATSLRTSWWLWRRQEDCQVSSHRVDINLIRPWFELTDFTKLL